MVAPPEVSRGLSAVLEFALIMMRHIARTGGDDARVQIEALADATHNIPRLIREWERVDINLLRIMLDAYDEKWTPPGALTLWQRYERARDEKDAFERSG